MLTEEYETMALIFRKMIDMAEEKIKRKNFIRVRISNKGWAKAKSEIREIHHNIGVVITEQETLLLTGTPLRLFIWIPLKVL